MQVIIVVISSRRADGAQSRAGTAARLPRVALSQNMCISIYIYIYIVCLFVYIYIYIYICIMYICIIHIYICIYVSHLRMLARLDLRLPEVPASATSVSKVQSGKIGQAPGAFELTKGTLR